MPQESLLPLLNGLRILIIYDNFYTLGSLCFYAAPYYLIKGGDVYAVLYSEHVYRNAKKIYEYVSKNYPMFSEILNSINVVKIGVNDDISFGKPYRFINENDNWIDHLTELMENVNEEDLIVLFGFSLLVPIYKDDAPKFFLKMYNAIPEGVTVFCPYYKKTYENYPSDFIDLLHDVVFYIRRNEAFLDQEVYTLEILQGLVGVLKPMSINFKIEKDFKLKRI